MSSSDVGIAYWRPKMYDKCEFKFDFQYRDDMVSFSKDVIAVINIEATVNNLLNHINRKVNYFIKDAYKKLEIDLEPVVEIDINAILKNDKGFLKTTDTCEKVLKRYHVLYFTILDQNFEVKVNAPLIISFSLPDFIFCGMEISPKNFKFIAVDKNKSKFFWYRSKDKDNWKFIDSGWAHKVTRRDLDHYLKLSCTPENLIHVGDPYEAVTKHVIYEPPEIPNCPFEERHLYTKTYLKQNHFRLMTYNILSEKYCKADNYQYCDIPYLSIEYRKQLLKKEIMGYHADIICLQEVDESVFNTYYSGALQQENYDFKFCKKVNSTEGLLFGCRRNRFDSIFKKRVPFRDLLLHDRSFGKFADKLRLCNADVYNELTRLGTILQLACLSFKNSDIVLFVANTHLYYHPDCDHIRLLQLQIAFKYIEREMKTFSHRQPHRRVIFIFCGDFNSNPDRATFKLFINSKVTKGPIIKKINKNGYHVSHSFQFASAYGTPQYTNYTGDYKGCLDYIFYEPENLSVTQVVPLPEESVLSENTALPSICFPSDHLALVADFEIL